MTDPADFNPVCVSSLAQSSKPSKREIMLAEQNAEMLFKKLKLQIFSLFFFLKDHLRKGSLKTDPV